MRNAIAGITTVSYIALGIIGVLIHIWSIAIVFSIKGLIWAVVAFFLPFVTQIYLIIISTGISGTFFNTYTVAVIGYAIGTIVLKIIFAACCRD